MIMSQLEAIEKQRKTGPGPASRHVKKVLKGNAAAALAARLCRVSFVTAYPITPQTSIIEEINAMIARKEFDATCVNMESEHSVFAALKGASLVGERVFTATSGQGLLYAHEVLHAIAHMRLPIVACNVGRPSYPWNIWADQTDSISQRDTGWIQFYCESAQEVLDTIIQSYKIAESSNMPVMVVLDAFYLSHTSENVYVPEQQLVDDFCPHERRTSDRVDPKDPKSFGGLVDPSKYDTYNRAHWEEMCRIEEQTDAVGREFEQFFGRNYGAVEAVNIGPQTKTVLVTMSSITTTARQVIADHEDTGLLKIRLFKPFPKDSVRKALDRTAKDCNVVAVDRNYTADREGALLQQLRQTMCKTDRKLFGVYAGLGGRDVSPQTIRNILDIDYSSPDTEEINWIQ